eukprot:155915_1
MDEETIEQMDQMLGQCHVLMGRNDYFNEYGVGKFKAFCIDEEFDTDIIPEELNTVKQEYDGASFSDGDVIGKGMWRVLGYCRYLLQGNKIQDDNNNKLSKQKLSWFNIANIINFEFDENVCKSLKKIKMNESKMNDNDIPTQEQLEQILNKLQTNINLPQDQYIWLLYVIKKFN